MKIESESSGARRAGFTMIELIVVIGIMILAAGLMAPTLADFFKNRQLENVRGLVGSALNRARLKAVTERRPISLVFFREGIRVFDEKDRIFLDEDDFTQIHGDNLWYLLGFLDSYPSTSLPQFEAWEKTHKIAKDTKKRSARRSRRSRSETSSTATTQYDVSEVPRVTFNRKGFLDFRKGADVSSVSFKKQDLPKRADIMIYQRGNASACYIDLKPAGGMQNKIVLLDNPVMNPPAAPEVADKKRKRSRRSKK